MNNNLPDNICVNSNNFNTLLLWYILKTTKYYIDFNFIINIRSDRNMNSIINFRTSLYARNRNNCCILSNTFHAGDNK